MKLHTPTQRRHAASFFAIALLGATVFASCQETLEQRAERTMLEYTQKNCPQQMGETIVMDSCRFETATHTMHYFYRFMGAMDNDSTLDADYMRQLLKDALRNETSTRTFKEAGYTFTYTYRSASQPDKVLFEATFPKEEYQ